jgi:hypothetical protein
MAALPQELISTIIGHLSDDHDRSSLKACSLVSQVFLPIAQSRIHFTATITQDNAEWASTNLGPSVAQYVREFDFISTNDNFDWLSRGPLVTILRQLTRLQIIHLCRFTWSELSSDLREELTRVLKGSQLHCVQMVAIKSLPISLFNSFAALKYLDVASVLLETPPDDIQPVPLSEVPHPPIGTPRVDPPLYLKSLGLSSAQELMSVRPEVRRKDMITIVDLLLGPSTALNVSHLRTLSYDTEFNDQVKLGFNRLLNACSTTIECIKMHAPLFSKSSSPAQRRPETYRLAQVTIDPSIMQWKPSASAIFLVSKLCSSSYLASVTTFLGG